MTTVDTNELHGDNNHVRAQFRAIFAELPDSFEERYDKLSALRQVFTEELATAIQHHLNEYLSQQPQESLAEKAALASRVNQLVRRVGLAIQFPDSDRVGILVADTKGKAHSNVARLRLASRSELGTKSHKILATRGKLPPLTLVPDDPALRWWQGRRQKDSDGPSLG